MIKEIVYGAFDSSYTQNDISRYNLLRSLLGIDNGVDDLYRQEEMKTIKAKNNTVLNIDQMIDISSLTFGSSAFDEVVYTAEI